MAHISSLPVHSHKKLHRLALYLSLGYLVICAVYIIISGDIALSSTQSPQQLALMERYKGLAFVFFTSLLFYVITRILVRRILQQESELNFQRRALLEAEMRGAAGLMAASVAHDIKNVLTLFNFQIYRLNRGQPETGEQHPVLDKLAEGVDRLDGLAKRLLALSRTGVMLDAQDQDLVAVIQDNVEFLRLHETVRSCELTLSTSAPIPMMLHRGLIDQMMLNLLINAAEAINGRGKIQVAIRQDGGDAVIEVHDNGPGIEKKGSTAIFDAFYTTKTTGHGLGLYTVKACAELHGGVVSVEPSALGGACFRVSIPVAGPQGRMDTA